MARKTDILDFIKQELARIDGSIDTRAGIPKIPYEYKSNIFGNSFKEFKFLDEINDFPTITFIVSDESREHYGADERFGILNFIVRAYVHGENALDLADDILEDIEFILNSIAFSCTNGIEELVLNSTSTDEGLFEPYGIAEINASLRYNVT